MTTRIRVAVAQIHSIPAYATQVVYHLFEPAPPVERAPFYLANVRNKGGVSAFMNRCHAAHLRDLDCKLRSIATHCAAHKVDLLLLPEYSIPREQLAQLRSAAVEGRYAVIAGSHTITTSETALADYRAIGFDFIAKDPPSYVRKAIAPVFFPDGSATFGLKQFRSKWETDLVPHSGGHASFDVSAKSAKVRVELRICIDALASTDGGATDRDLLAVMARTPSVSPFQNIFAHHILREKPCIFANVASVGGSQIYAAGTATNPAWTELLHLGADECLLIADIDLDSQFKKLGSLNTPVPVSVAARAPLLYEAVPDHQEVSDYVVNVRGGVQPATARELARLERKPNVPDSVRTQLRLLREAIEAGTAAPADTNLLLDCVPVPRVAAPFWNRCEQALRLASQTVASHLAKEPDSQRLIESAQAIGIGLRAASRASFDIGEMPPSFLDAPIDGSAPFVNREVDQERLRGLLRENSVVAVYGLPGIGKRSLVEVVVNEELPRSERQDIHCVPDMGAVRFLDTLAEAIGRPLYDLEQMAPAARARLAHLVVVHDAEHICASEAEADQLGNAFDLLAQTGITVVLIATRSIWQMKIPRIRLRELDQQHLERILEYSCRSFGVEAPDNLVPHLHGHPLAAKLAARILRDGNHRVLDSLTFLSELRSELIESLLSAVRLGEQEKKALEALILYRRPVSDEALSYLSVEEMSAIDALEQRFLIDRIDGRVGMTPLVRWAIMDRLKPSGAMARHHTQAAQYYETTLRESSDRVARYEAREEAIYHHSSAGNLKAAQALGRDWENEARAAVTDLYRRRDYDRCNQVCEAILTAKGPSIEILGRSALCLARRRRWTDARERLEAAQRMGAVPTNFVTGYAEALISGGILSEGISLLEEVVTTTRDAYATAALAEAYLQSNQPDLAKKWALEAVEANPTSVRALDVASRVARQERSLKAAYVLARRAMAIHPGRAEHNFNKVLSLVRAEFGGAVPEEFTEAAESAIGQGLGSDGRRPR